MKDKVLFVAILGLAITGISLAITNPFDLPMVYAQVDSEYINRNSIYANEINNQFEPNILYEYIDSDGVIQNNVYEIFLVDEKPNAPFPKYTDLKLGNFPYYQLTFDEGIYKIKSLKENVDVSINPDFCTVHVSNQDEEIIENWQVYSSQWGVDNWQLLPVNDNECQFEIWNDNQGVYWNFIKEDEFGKFASGYHYSTWKVESTQSYYNFDQTTLGEIDENDNIISGNPYKFGFTQNLIGSDFFVDDSFQLYTNIDDELTSSKISYAFADSKDLLWGAKENSDGTYFDFKYAKEPTNFNEVLSIDPFWDSTFTTPYLNVWDFSDRDPNGRVMMIDYSATRTLMGFNENTGNGVWTENSNGGVTVNVPKGGIAVQGSGSSYALSDYGNNYKAVTWSFNNNNPTTPVVGSQITPSLSSGRGYDHDYSNSNNYCYTEYMSAKVTCSGFTISSMTYPQSVEWNNYMNWACASGADSTSYAKGYVFECKDTSGNIKINTYFGNYGTGLHTLIPSSVTSSPTLTSGWDSFDFDDTNGDLHWIDGVNGLIYVFELNPTQTDYIYKDYYGNGMGTGNGQFTYPIAIKLIHNTANTDLDYIFVSDYSAGEVEVFIDTPPPDPPTNLSLSETVANQLDLSWSAPTSGTTPTSYQIDRSLDGSTWTTIVSDTGSTGTTYSDTGLTLNTDYYYRVFTLANGIPSATASNTASQTTWNVPDQVTGVTAQDGNPITISWTQPNSDDIITGYKLYRDTNYIKTVTGTSTTDTPPNLGQTYSYTVSAVSGVGEGSQSASASAIYGNPPDPPTGVSTSINNPNLNPFDITVSWSAPTNVGTGTLTGFEIWRDGSLVTTVGLISSYMDIVPTVGTYTYTVKAVSTHGTSVDSNSAQITTPNVPDAPQGLTLSIDNPDPSPLTVTVTVSPPLNDGGSTITGYNIYTSTDDITYTLQASNTSNPSNITVPNAGVWYFKAEAVNGVGVGALSNNAIISTPTVPDAPSLSLAINDPNANPLTITTTFTEGATNGGSTVTGFNLYSSPDDINYNLVAGDISSPYSTTVSNAGTWYFKAEAVNNVGDSPVSISYSIATPTVPNAPASVSTSIPDVNNAPSTVVITWTAPVDNGGSALTGYNVYRDGSLITNVGAGILTFTDTDVKTINTQYTYEVKATNNVGEGLGTTSNITTPNIPLAPTLSILSGTTKLTWTTPTSDGTIIGYKIYRDSSLIKTTGLILTYTDMSVLNWSNSYDYEVSAVSTIGEGALSNTVIGQNFDTNVDDATAFGTTGTSSIIDWTEPAYFQGNVTSYSVYYSTPYSSNPSTLIGTTGNTYLNLYNQLQYDTNYAFMVLVNSPLGNTSVGNVVNATTTENLSIVTYDPTTGADWFDIDAVNQEDLSTTKYTRVDNGDVVLLEIEYPTNYEDMTCDVGFKFGQQTLQYVEGEDMTATALDAEHQAVIMQFNNQGNEVITVECADQNVPNSGSSYTVTTTFGNFPLLTQITDFRTGQYGTNGMFGALDLITLFVVIISMVGFNRINPVAGVIIGVSAIAGLAYFEVINLPPALIGIFALLAFLAWGVTRK